MKKTFICLLLILSLSCLLFISCDPSVPSKEPEGIKETVDQSLKNLEAGGSIEIDNVGSDTEFNLSEFSLEDGIFIEIVNSKGKAIGSSKAIDSPNFFQRQDGSIMPIPDSNGKISFKGNELGLANGVKVIINRLLHLDTDFQISTNEYSGTGKRVAEEYYYVNFLLSGLNPNEVVLVETGRGAHDIRLVQRGMLNKDISGVLDLSQYALTGFAVNMYLGLDESDPNQKMTLHILNPINVTETPQSLTEKLNVIKVSEQSSTSDKMIVIKFNNPEIVMNIALSTSALLTKPRWLEPKIVNDKKITNRSVNIIPEYDLDTNTIIYHLGKVDESFIFNLDWEEAGYNYESDGAEIYIKDDDTEWAGFNDISDIDNPINISSKHGKLVTWAFQSNRFYNVYVENKYRVDRTRMYYINDYMGGGSGLLREFFFNTDSYGDVDDSEMFTGYILINCVGKSTDEEVITLKNADNLGIDCAHVVFNLGEYGAYQCTDPLCGKTYSIPYLEACYKNIFKGTFIDPANNKFGVFGTIYHTEDGLIDNSGIERHGDNGTAVDYRMKERTILIDGTERWIEARLQEIINEPNEDKKLVYDVYWYEQPDTPIRVTFVLDCEHDWTNVDIHEVDDNHSLFYCKNCGSSRLAYKVRLSSLEKQGYHIVLNNLPIAIYVSENELYTFDDSEFVDLSELPQIGEPYGVDVYAFSTEPGHILDVEIEDNTSDDDKPSVYTISFDDLL